MEEEKIVTEEVTQTQTVEASSEPTDDAIKIEALQELLKENNDIVKALKEELTAVKKDNAKMLARLDVSKVADVGDDIDALFNKYRRG